MRSDWVGNGEAVVRIASNLSVDWWWHAGEQTTLGIDRWRRGKDGGGIDFQSLADDVVQPVKQQYVPQTNVLRTECRLGDVVVSAVDFMPWDTPLLIRDLTVRNEGSKGTPFQPTFVPNLTGVIDREEQQGMEGKTIIFEQERSRFAYRMEGAVGYLDPGEEAVVRAVFAYGKTQEEIDSALDDAEVHVPQESIFEWERWFWASFPEASNERLRLTLKLLVDEETGRTLVPFSVLADALSHVTR